MKTLGTPSNPATKNVICAPGYPFAARVLLQALRTQLAQELRQPMTFDALGKIIDRPRSTTHRWFDISSQPQLIAFMCLLERLSPRRRHAFIDRHCREFPTLESPRLAYSSIMAGRLMRLFELPAGLTIITGGTESSRTFLAAALGHVCVQGSAKRHAVAGIDLHRPDNFVPVPGIDYIDGTLGPKRAGEIAETLLPKVLASSAPLLVFGGLWSVLPGWRRELLRCASHKHVILAEAGMPNLPEVKKLVRIPINILTVSATQRVPEGIRVKFRREKVRKGQQTRTF